MSVRHAIVKWGDFRIVWADSQDPHAAITYVRDHGLDGIGISPAHGFIAKDIRFLEKNTDLKGLVVVDNEEIDLSPIERCELLRFLVVENVRQELNLNRLANVIDLNLGWSSLLQLPSPEVAIGLTRLQLWGYKAHDLQGLPAYGGLHRLSLVRSSIETLSGIGRFLELRQIDLHYCHKLVDVGAAVESRMLREFTADHCRNVMDFSVLRGCSSLRVLGMNNCGSIPSLAFVGHMKLIEDLRFVDTIIVDGDLSPCVGLRHIGFTNKRHYSHRFEDFHSS